MLVSRWPEIQRSERLDSVATKANENRHLNLTFEQSRRGWLSTWTVGMVD